MTAPQNLHRWEPTAAQRQVRDDCARAFFVAPERLVVRDRSPHVVLARHAACWVLRQMFGLSWPQIGAMMGGRDHSTVIHGAAQAEARRAIDPAFRQRTDELAARVPVADLTPLPEAVVVRFLRPKPVVVRASNDELVQDARRVRERNRFYDDPDALNRFNASRALGAAIAASGGQFR